MNRREMRTHTNTNTNTKLQSGFLWLFWVNSVEYLKYCVIVLLCSKPQAFTHLQWHWKTRPIAFHLVNLLYLLLSLNHPLDTAVFPAETWILLLTPVKSSPICRLLPLSSSENPSVWSRASRWYCSCSDLMAIRWRWSRGWGEKFSRLFSSVR